MRWTGRASCQNGSKSACRGYCISIQLIAYQTGEKLPKMGTFRDTDVSSDSALKLVPFVGRCGTSQILLIPVIDHLGRAGLIEQERVLGRGKGGQGILGRAGHRQRQRDGQRENEEMSHDYFFSGCGFLASICSLAALRSSSRSRKPSLFRSSLSKFPFS